MTMLRVRQTATSSAPMPNARPWRRRQRPAAAQRCAEGAGLDGVDRGRSTISCAVPHTGESLTTSLTGPDAPMRASPTSRIYTCLTDVTRAGKLIPMKHGEQRRGRPHKVLRHSVLIEAKQSMFPGRITNHLAYPAHRHRALRTVRDMARRRGYKRRAIELKR
jgi:hypothetical protein